MTQCNVVQNAFRPWARVSWHLEEVCALCDLAAGVVERGSAAADVACWSPLVQSVACLAQAALGAPQILPGWARWARWALDWCP